MTCYTLHGTEREAIDQLRYLYPVHQRKAEFAVPSRLEFSGDTKDAGFPPALTFDSISVPDSFYFPLKISPLVICAILKLLEKFCPYTSLKLNLLTFFF